MSSLGSETLRCAISDSQKKQEWLYTGCIIANKRRPGDIAQPYTGPSGRDVGPTICPVCNLPLKNRLSDYPSAEQGVQYAVYHE